MEITIFTPAYNREKYLPRLYKSLLNQTNQAFEWLVIDDGSTDGTEELVKSFINENKIKIRYYKQKNSGKHVAHNKAVELCNTELIFCVDSDDYLTDDAIETILEIWKKRNKNKVITGIIALRGYNTQEVMCNEMPKNIKESTLSDLYNIHGKKGETAIVLNSTYLKENLFPVFENERFLSEEVLYNILDGIGTFIILNKIIYVMEYLDDGLTKNYIRNWVRSPKGTICLLKSRYNVGLNLRGYRKVYRAIRNIIVFNAFCMKVNYKIKDNTPNIILSYLFILPSVLFKFIRFV